MQHPVPPDEARLILREGELDAVLELFFLAEAGLRLLGETAMAPEGGLGAGHYRALFLLKRRPGVGVRELANLTGLSKQRVSKVLRDLENAGLATAAEPAEDARRRPMRLSEKGATLEARVSERLRAHLAGAYREAGLDAAVGARRVLAALAGSRARRGERP